MDDGIRIDEVDLEGEIPLSGKAVLIELSASDGYDHITVSYDPPNGGESFGTVDVRQLDGVGTVPQTLEAAMT